MRLRDYTYSFDSVSGNSSVIRNVWINEKGVAKMIYKNLKDSKLYPYLEEIGKSKVVQLISDILYHFGILDYDSNDFIDEVKNMLDDELSYFVSREIERKEEEGDQFVDEVEIYE